MSAVRKLLLFLVAPALAVGSLLSAAELVEQIVVRVNDRLITQSEFDKRLAIAAKAPGRQTSDMAELERTVLEDLIREKLLEERAKEMSVAATDEEVDAAVARVKAQYNLSTDAEFDAALAQSGMTRDELKRQMRQTITLQKVIGARRRFAPRAHGRTRCAWSTSARRNSSTSSRNRPMCRRSCSSSRPATPRRVSARSPRSSRCAFASRRGPPSPT